MRAAVKYLYKYIFKGFDVASLTFTNGGQQIRSNEVRDYISCRYVSAPEAIWRIYEFRMHDRSHTVVRLPVHLENQSEIHFNDGFNEQAEREEITLRSMLIAFFDLNCQPNSNSRNLLYTEIPTHYVYESRMRRWNERRQRGNYVVSRMRNVNPCNMELFALRVLLLHVRGPRSFEDLRSINGHLYATYHEAAQALHLVRNDDIFLNTFRDLQPLQMPKQLRQLLANMLLNNIINTGLQFWELFKNDMIADFRAHYRDASNDELYSLALHHLNDLFLVRGKTCASYHLPMPQGNNRMEFNPPQQPIELGDGFALNQAQQRGYDQIMGALHGQAIQHPVQFKCFVVIGPGGSGKTTLYRKIIESCREFNWVARVYATTGIAATLMEGGLTVHRGFKLPINLDAESFSRLERDRSLPESVQLQQASIILIDEITMMLKDGLRVIDKILKFIMSTDEPFGGKIIVVGGDFRQLLPVVPRASREEIIAQSVINSSLWRHFKVISLTQNMRAQGDQEFNQWLLDLGTGMLPPIPELNDPTMVEIPDYMILQVPDQQQPAANGQNDPEAMPIALEAMITHVFGADVNLMPHEDLAKRAILASTIKETMKVNDFIIAKLNGAGHQYLSLDSLISDDPTMEENFPVEYLNNLQPSGIPPHILNLKVGAVIMLIRNLNPEGGLSNGTRLVVQQMLPNAIKVKIISESHRDDIHFISRMDLVNEDNSMPFKLKRQQFPVIPSFAMTINKSQGQTIEHVGLYLNDVVFSHGQLYVALSRCRNARNIKVYCKDQGTRQGRLLGNNRVFTKNVVYREVFKHGEMQTREIIQNPEAIIEEDEDLWPVLSGLSQVSIEDIEIDNILQQVPLSQLIMNHMADEAQRMAEIEFDQANARNYIDDIIDNPDDENNWFEFADD